MRSLYMRLPVANFFNVLECRQGLVRFYKKANLSATHLAKEDPMYLGCLLSTCLKFVANVTIRFPIFYYGCFGLGWRINNAEPLKYHAVGVAWVGLLSHS